MSRNNPKVSHEAVISKSGRSGDTRMRLQARCRPARPVCLGPSVFLKKQEYQETKALASSDDTRAVQGSCWSISFNQLLFFLHSPFLLSLSHAFSLAFSHHQWLQLYFTLSILLVDIKVYKHQPLPSHLASPPCKQTECQTRKTFSFLQT